MLIGELSIRSGVSARALRYYEEQRLLVPSRAPNGYREYAEDAPVVVAQIQELFKAGFDSAAVRRFLPCSQPEPTRLDLCPELRDYLTQRVAAFDAELAAIRRKRTAAVSRLI